MENKRILLNLLTPKKIKLPPEMYKFINRPTKMVFQENNFNRLRLKIKFIK